MGADQNECEDLTLYMIAGWKIFYTNDKKMDVHMHEHQHMSPKYVSEQKTVYTHHIKMDALQCAHTFLHNILEFKIFLSYITWERTFTAMSSDMQHHGLPLLKRSLTYVTWKWMFITVSAQVTLQSLHPSERLVTHTTRKRTLSTVSALMFFKMTMWHEWFITHLTIIRILSIMCRLMQLQILPSAKRLITHFARIRTFNCMPICITFLSNWTVIHITFCISIIICWFTAVRDRLCGHNCSNCWNRHGLETHRKSCLVTLSYVQKYCEIVWCCNRMVCQCVTILWNCVMLQQSGVSMCHNSVKSCDVATELCVNVSQSHRLELLKNTNTLCTNNYI
jgi:hypothetical protein